MSNKTNAKLVFYCLTTSLVIMKYLTFSKTNLVNSLNSLIPFSDSYYFDRIYSAKNSFFIESPYVGNGATKNLNIDSFSLPENMNRAIFFILDKNIALTYYVFALICLTFLFFLSIKLLNPYIDEVLFTLFFLSLGFIALFGNNSLIDTNYVFNRIISPQFHLVFWVFLIYLTYKSISEDDKRKLQIKLTLLSAATGLTLYLHYPFIFLCSIVSYFLVNIVIFIHFRNFRIFVLPSLVMVLLAVPTIMKYFSNTESVNSSDYFIRHGLIFSRFPGAIYPFIISIFILTFIRLFKIWSPRLGIIAPKHQLTALTISTIGVLFACQSNVITGYSLQFSDHFDFLANVNLILLFSLFIGCLPIKKTISLKISPRLLYYKHVNYQYILILSINTLLLSSLVSLPNLDRYNQDKLNYASAIKEKSVQNLIIDIEKVSPISFLTSANILYSPSIVNYEYSNRDLLNRLLVSKGCIENLNKRDTNPIYTPSIEATKQKINTINKVNSLFSLPFLDSHIRQLRSEIIKREVDFKIEIDDVLTNPEISCIQRALNYGITAVIYSSNSEWNTIIKSSNLSQKQIFDDTYISYIN